MSNKEVFKRVSSYVGRYKIHLFFSMFLALVSVASMLYIPILIGRAIDGIIGAGNVDFQRIANILLQICADVGVCAVSQWIMNALNNKITYNVVRDMRARAFSKIESLPISFIDSNQTGDIVSRVISDVDQFADGLLMGFTQFFTGIVTIIITLAFMLSINLWIAIVVVVVTPVSFLIAGFIAKKTHKMFTLQSRTRGEQTAFIDEMVGNQKIVDAFSMQEENTKRFDEINQRLGKYSLKAIFYSSITNPATRFVNTIVYTSVAFFGALLAVKT